jgi:TetR/AcrR family transcriptional repressor of nem operon
MARPSKRNEIIRSGVGTLFRKGYAGAGVRDITAEAGVPLGSFTNHFGSKEEFAWR